MSFLRYIFSFLYARHPETGVWYLSMPRVYVFGAGTLLLLVALIIISILQTPIEYINSD